MADRPALDIRDLPASMRKQLRTNGVKPTRRQTMSKDQVRTHAFRVCAIVADLAPAERRRVLKLALQLNEV